MELFLDLLWPLIFTSGLFALYVWAWRKLRAWQYFTIEQDGKDLFIVEPRSWLHFKVTYKH